MAREGYGRWLVLMVKEPRLGRVKTRLAREIGSVPATRFYRTTARNMIRRLARDRRWRMVLAVAPDTALASPAWPAELPRLAQGRGDLGDRMQHVMDVLPPGPALIIGTDIPAIRPGHLARAFRLLGTNDAVFGAAGDGGYWLVGLKRMPRVRQIFRNVRWSTAHALADTQANLAGRRVGRAAEISDVDGAEDYRRHGGAGARVVCPPWQR